jgi:hypothetical protein
MLFLPARLAKIQSKAMVTVASTTSLQISPGFL